MRYKTFESPTWIRISNEFFTGAITGCRGDCQSDSAELFLRSGKEHICNLVDGFGQLMHYYKDICCYILGFSQNDSFRMVF